MNTTSDYARTVALSAVRNGFEPVARYVERRLHAAWATIGNPDTNIRPGARRRARVIRDELQALAELLERLQSVERRADEWHRDHPAEAVANARAWFQKHGERWAQIADQATREDVQRMYGVAAAELLTMAELLAPPPQVEPRPAVHVVMDLTTPILFCKSCDLVFASIRWGEDLDSVNAKRDAHTCEAGRG
ncbi:hypothetical protein HII36_54075 [Nonomuraea sp. NN258]|uniref:hypothetical protein n=1 Tax=Nonomuraea antri TaxID=2730852 RepID=UPI0015690076|nr:hypothetical protein [Nonomuraea antri]NRQ40684.1 hypothetical protein [Nonomuraea antri]